MIRQQGKRWAGYLLLATLLHVFTTIVVAGYYSYEDAEAFYQSGLVEPARQVFRQLADKGHEQAQYRLGTFYRDGKGEEQDNRLACDWFERAANQGHAGAMHELGHCYFNGEGRERNITAGLYLYELAAESGLPDAQYRLAHIYAGDSGVTRDPLRAYVYLYLASGGDLSQAPELAGRIESWLDERQLDRARRQAMRQQARQKSRQR